MDDLDQAKYVSLTTFRKDGTPVATPVWIVGAGGVYRIMTDDGSGKVKRIRNNPAVEVAVSDSRGRVAEGAARHEGTARLLDEAESERTVADVYAKYKLMGSFIKVLHRVSDFARRRPARREIGLEVTLAVSR